MPVLRVEKSVLDVPIPLSKMIVLVLLERGVERCENYHQNMNIVVS